ncbi:RNaseH domain-containing protein [Streptomyces sp. AK04-3B]|uniref:RNaseH domain-containing protein n=1 Tax=Streptomyces sp. AK04-3B TaxID=3028650 RepID=UPI0029BF74BD|nr:RNaseH domain-containing protein [Streptomyces sp. AK04-3B]MDX3798953.1 RNaseH domain-containing protein [Streptomyces sp. AK04-3B]
MITTLAFLFPHTALGTVTLYPLERDFGEAWSNLPTSGDAKNGKPRRPPYSGLAAALSAVSGQPVILMPHSYERPDDELASPAVAVTTRAIAPDTLAMAVREWERRVRKGDDANTLAPLLAEAEVQHPNLASYVRGSDDGRPYAPGWFYRVAAWNFAQRLARNPLPVPNGPADLNVRWRMDTQGSLISWDHVIKRSILKPKRTGYAIHKLDFRVITLPGEPLFALHVLPTFSRLATHWANTRTVFIDHGKGALLRMPIGHTKNSDGEWVPYARNFASEVIEACGMDFTDWPTNEGLSDLSGQIRALVPGPIPHPLGKGVGTRFNKILADHISATIKRPKITQVTFGRTDIELTRPTKGAVSREDLDHALVATCWDRVRIIALYNDGTTRRRMAETLAQYTDTPDQPLDCSDRTDHPLTRRLAVHFRRLPALDRADAVDWHTELSALDELEDGSLNGAWVETIWNPKPSKREREANQHRHDHKRDLRRALYDRGIVSQFLARQPEPEPNEDDDAEEVKAPKDYKAVNALRDLFFRLGFVDDRLCRVTDLTAEPILVGIHLRQQRVSNRRPGGADRTQMVEILTALHTSSDSEQPWHLKTYDHHTHDWRPQAEAEAAFGRGPIGRDGHARHEDGALLARQHIDSALKVLPSDRPLIIFVDTEACRTIWPGLQNIQFATGSLPGDDLQTDTRPVAVVAINTAYGEVPAPVENAASNRRSPKRPPKPRDYLYQRTTSTGITSWYTAQASRSYEGFGSAGSIGGVYTRFTLPEEEQSLQRKDWHSFTAVQITVPRAAGHDPKQLASLAAQLCHQSLAWDARTRHPVPLHVAAALDRAHPEYRGPSLDTPEPITNETEIAEGAD